MTILVTGGNGQLATELAKVGGESVLRVGRPAFDFDRPETIEAAFRDGAPSLVINAAAYTAVDAAESDAAAAFRANRDGPMRLAQLCTRAGVPLIHISTDYVFDGLKGTPYVEDDPTSPQSVYGASKLAGERAVLDSGARVTVLRTSWVYAATGKNFVRTMLSAAQRMPRLRVVADQKGCPTSAADLADAVLAVARRVLHWDDRFAGVFHAAGSGWTTWHGFATAVFDEAEACGEARPGVDAITTADWPTPARRPPDSRLDCRKLARVFDVRFPDWRASVGPTVRAILAG